jgi:WD40 repeat protein
MVKLWELESGREVQTLQGHTGYVASVAFTPDGRHLASGSGDGTVKLWEVASAREVQTLRGHPNFFLLNFFLLHPVLSVAVSPDGHYLASGGANKKVKLWDVTGPK